MKKYIIALLLTGIFMNKTKACSWSSEDATYYNLFDQQLISDKSLLPFFLTYDYTFYDDINYEQNQAENPIIDYNILEWKKYFNNQLNEQELHYLVYQSSVADLSKISTSKSLKGINDGSRPLPKITAPGILGT